MAASFLCTEDPADVKVMPALTSSCSQQKSDSTRDTKGRPAGARPARPDSSNFCVKVTATQSDTNLDVPTAR